MVWILITYVSSSLQARVFDQLRARHHPPACLPASLADARLGARPRAGLEVRTASGAPYYTTSTSGTPIALLDFTNPAAVRWWQRDGRRGAEPRRRRLHAGLRRAGAAGMHFYNGATGATMHNRVAGPRHRATREAIGAYERSTPVGRSFFYTRRLQRHAGRRRV